MARILTNRQVPLAWAHKAAIAYVWLGEEGTLLQCVFPGAPESQTACFQDSPAYEWPSGFEGEGGYSFPCLNIYFLPNN